MSIHIVPTLVCCLECSLSISNEGHVYSFGRHVKGGHGHQEELVKVPKKIPYLKQIQSIDCGLQHTICLDRKGNVFSFGSNQYRQLGLGNLGHTHVPKIVPLPPIKQISCGDNFTVCLSNVGKVFTFGENSQGQLGHFNSGAYPSSISCLKNIEFICCGGSFTICKNNKNELYGWGSNEFGQLGNNNASGLNTVLTPLKNTDIDIGEIVDVKCGKNHTLILTANQEVYSCGDNQYGQLGREKMGKYPEAPEKIDIGGIVRIECGTNHSICSDMYDVYIFGHNFYGQLGFGDGNDRDTPTPHPSLSNIIDISSRGNHVFVKTSLDEIYAFGRNDASQLGVETLENGRYPIRVLNGNEDLWKSPINNEQKRKNAKSARK